MIKCFVIIFDVQYNSLPSRWRELNCDRALLAGVCESAFDFPAIFRSQPAFIRLMEQKDVAEAGSLDAVDAVDAVDADLGKEESKPLLRRLYFLVQLFQHEGVTLDSKIGQKRRVSGPASTSATTSTIIAGEAHTAAIGAKAQGKRQKTSKGGKTSLHPPIPQLIGQRSTVGGTQANPRSHVRQPPTIPSAVPGVYGHNLAAYQPNGAQPHVNAQNFSPQQKQHQQLYLTHLQRLFHMYQQGKFSEPDFHRAKALLTMKARTQIPQAQLNHLNQLIQQHQIHRHTIINRAANNQPPEYQPRGPMSQPVSVSRSPSQSSAADATNEDTKQAKQISIPSSSATSVTVDEPAPEAEHTPDL